MNGLEISQAYFEEFGRAVLEKDFPDLLPYLAVGLVGKGSERFGFDDEISRDHDFEPGFCLFLPGEDIVSRRQAFLLERAYAKLPKEFAGIARQTISPVGGNRTGVIRTADFYTETVGSPDGNLSMEAWLSIPDGALAEAVNGKVFFDHYGEFSAIREKIQNMPEGIRLKRLAGQVWVMAQSGQYNYLRCLRHGEAEAAQHACQEFTEAAMKAFFLLSRKYMPYYKWSFRALRRLENGESLAQDLSFILMEDHRDRSLAEQKEQRIEQVASFIIDLLQKEGITKAICTDLEKHAYSINDHISDSHLRNLHLLASIQ